MRDEQLNHERLNILAREIGEHLRVVQQILRRPVEAEFARGHLTGPQQLVMEVLVRSDGLSLKELSKRVSLSHSTVSGIVDRLEQRGFLKRKPSPDDRRFTVITPSKQVQEFLKKKLPMLTIHPLVEVLGKASLSEQEVILGGLRALRRLVESRKEDN
jgi:MarR family transcriptional regulator, organic hydroperoxide resistance regulator